MEYDGFLRIDPDAFRRVIINLTANARDSFSNHGDSVAPEVVIGARKKSGLIHITISDNGSGIPDEIKPNIFEPFHSHGKKAGTGLGLSLSKQIVDNHGGSLSFESESKKGTVFQITLPK